MRKAHDTTDEDYGNLIRIFLPPSTESLSEDPRKSVEVSQIAGPLKMKLSCVALLLLPLLAGAVKTSTLDKSLRNLRKAKKGKKGKKGKGMVFNRMSTFLICSQIDPTCNDDTETVAEIVVASEDGMMLIYTDSETGNIGFVDIADPEYPVGMGMVDVGGEPTSVAVKGRYAIAGVNTSENFIDVSGKAVVIDIYSKNIVATIDLGGQPDAVATSPDGNFAAIAIENERDEDLGDGAPPQMPAGFLSVIDTSSADPSEWTASRVYLTNLPGVRFPSDPEPEYVSINSANVAVVTLQENNALVLVDLETGSVISSYTAGDVDLDQIDTEEEDVIDQSFSLTDVPREPDGVTWIGETNFFATADEGDLDGGSRGFTVYNARRETVAFSSGNFLEHLTARLGHYNEGRSGNKGNEPENVAYGDFGRAGEFLFVNSERSGIVSVWDISRPASPEFVQALPTGVGPEGVYTIGSRGLFVVAAEVDDRGDKIRSGITIYGLSSGPAQYPTLVSADRPDGTPIPWSAMSGLAAETRRRHRRAFRGQILYAVEDSAYRQSRFFTIDTSSHPAVLIRETRIMDTMGVLAGVAPEGEFSAEDLAALINSDYTVNIDPEGIAVSSTGGLWIVSEGRGTVGDEGRPVESLNFLIKVSMDGVIQQVVTLPPEVNAMQLRFGFEGVAEGSGPYEGKLVVAFQRAWGDEAYPRIGVYNTYDGSWQFYWYELDAPTSQNGGWVGLSDIAPIPGGTGGEFLLIERDNQGGPDGAIKKLYRIDLDQEEPGTVIAKYPVMDLVPELLSLGGLLYEKIEGLAVTRRGEIWIINDNDGVDDNSGETQLLNLGYL